MSYKVYCFRKKDKHNDKVAFIGHTVIEAWLKAREYERENDCSLERCKESDHSF